MHSPRIRRLFMGGVAAVRLAIIVAMLGSLIVACSSATVQEPPFQRGLRAFNNNDYAAAYAAWEPAARAGDAEAQNGLGWLYAGGLGVRRDPEEAVRWYRVAAAQGQGGAQLNLANHYYYGLGVPVDRERAAELFQSAAEKGYAEAQNSLGRMYKAGEGVPRDPVRAAAWLTRAAEQGFPPAQNSLGLMYLKGEGVPKDYRQAYLWLELAVRHGVPGAEHNRDFVGAFLNEAEIDMVLAEADAWRRASP